MGNGGGSKLLRWPLLLLVLAVVVSKTVAFQGRLYQQHEQQQQQRLWQQKRQWRPLGRVQHRKGTKIVVYANVPDRATTIKEESKVGPSRNPERMIHLESPFMVSRRSAATSMVTTAASVLFSVPVVALAEEEEEEGTATPTASATLVGDSSQSSTTTDDALLDAPVAKTKTIEYTVEDFKVTLPENWKVITKYDATKSPSTPTIFSAIDFNSGAVISVVREEACSVADYARTSFEKASSKTKNAKKCDFVLKSTEEGVNLFSTEGYEKDASKLLIRHDDRDNAVLRGVSKVDTAELVGKGGLRRVPPNGSSVSGNADSVKVESYSSSLLELGATTTIPTGGTYRDTMGLEQPNTIDRKVLAKAVATTTKVTQKVDARTELVPPPSSDAKLLATESETESKESSYAETTKSELVTSSTKSSDPNGATNTAKNLPTAAGTSATDFFEVNPSSIEDSREKSAVVTAASNVSDTKSPASDTPIGSSPSELVEIYHIESSQENPTASNSPKAAMLAMIATLDVEKSPASDTPFGSSPSELMEIYHKEISQENPTASNSPTVESTPNSLSSDAIDKAVEAAMEKAMETAIEAVKENSIEPTIEAVMETAKETAKEMAKEMLTTESAATTAISDTTPPSYDETLVASASPTETNDPSAAPAMTTTVLSIWLSAPLDEWQKPVMGTKLNQIWESVQYTSDIIEGSDNLAMLSQDDDDALAAQLLLMNNKAF